MGSSFSLPNGKEDLLAMISPLLGIDRSGRGG